MKRKSKFQRGFTLLELMVSMGLTVLLLSTLSAGVYVVVNDWQRENAGLDEALDKTLALLQIERALLAAFPYSYVDQERLDRFVFFNGTDNSLAWVSTISPQRQGGLTAWYFDADNDSNLLLSLTPAYGDNPQERLYEVAPTLLLQNYSAEFRYLLQQDDNEAEWLDEWQGDVMQSMPVAVHIILTPTSATGDPKFEILATIKASAHEDIQPNLPVF